MSGSFAILNGWLHPSVNTHEALPDLQSEKVELLSSEDLQALPLSPHHKFPRSHQNE
jgi:hypothetical protein